MRFVALTPELLAMIPPREIEAAHAAKLAAPAAAALVCRHGIAALDGGYVLGAGGVIPVDDSGRGLLWLMPGLFARPRHIVAAVPFAYAWLGRLIADGRFRRLEATSAHAPGCRLLAHLGFRCETPQPMRRYGLDGGDHWLFSRVSP